MPDGSASFQISADDRGFQLALKNAKDGLAGLHADVGRVGPGLGALSNGFAGAGAQSDKFGHGLRQVTQTVNTMGQEVLSRLNPALAGAAGVFSVAAREARNLPIALGAAVVGVTAASATLGIFIDRLQEAQKFQAQLGFAARSGDLGAVRSLMTESAQELELIGVRTRAANQNLSGMSAILEVIVSFWKNALNPDAALFVEHIKKASAELVKLAPIELQRITAEGRVRLFESDTALFGTRAQRAEAMNDLEGFAAAMDRLRQVNSNIAAEQDKAAVARATTARMGVTARTDLSPEGRQAELALIDRALNLERETIWANLFAKEEALQERIRTGRTGIETRRINPDVPAEGGEFVGVPSEAEQSAAVAARSKVFVELQQRMQAIRVEATLFGPEFDAIAPSLDTVRGAMRALIAEGLDPASPRLQQLKADFDGLKRVQDVKDVFHDTFGEARAGLSQFTRDLRSGTVSVGEAFAALGERIAMGFLDAVIKKGLEPVELALADFAAKLAQSGLGSLFSFPGLSLPRSGAFSGSLGFDPSTFLMDIAPFQHGGLVRGGMGGVLALIGEGRHDEAIVPLDHDGFGGGSTIIINNNAPGAAVEHVGQRQMPDGRIIDEIVVKALDRAADSGRLDSTMARNWGASRRPFRR